ncbi:MAG: DinB family protein [Candidatus Thorarchaeota archaeon]|jgi:uncharacterized damage-inducible protein DinB
MTQKAKGRVGELLRFGLGARNWLLTQMENPGEHFSWTPPEGGRSAAEIAEHVTSVVELVCSMIAERLEIDLVLQETDTNGERADVMRGQIQLAYEAFKDLCAKLDDKMLDETMTLPPPARVREGFVETVLRITAGYHVVHHAGQIVMLLKRAKRA